MQIKPFNPDSGKDVGSLREADSYSKSCLCVKLRDVDPTFAALNCGIKEGVWDHLQATQFSEIDAIFILSIVEAVISVKLLAKFVLMSLNGVCVHINIWVIWIRVPWTILRTSLVGLDGKENDIVARLVVAKTCFLIAQ